MTIIKKFWLVQNGAVGTAHRNREGALVEFRPVVKPSVLKVCPNGTATFVLAPPKGVEIEQLVLQATRANRETLQDEVCFRVFRDTWHAEFEGVSFSETNKVTEDKDTPEAAASREAAEAKRQEEKEDRARAERELEERLRGLTPTEFLQLIQPTAAEWGRLGSPNWGPTMHELERRVHTALTQLPDGAYRPEIPKAWFAAMRQSLLDLKAAEKAKRKAEFTGRG